MATDWFESNRNDNNIVYIIKIIKKYIIFYLGHIICVAWFPIGKTVVTIWVVVTCCGTNGDVGGTPFTAKIKWTNTNTNMNKSKLLIISIALYLVHMMAELMEEEQIHKLVVVRLYSFSRAKTLKYSNMKNWKINVFDMLLLLEKLVFNFSHISIITIFIFEKQEQ